MKKYFTLAIVATMFVACRNEVVVSKVDALTGTPIRVNPHVVNLTESRVAGNESEIDLEYFFLNIQGDTDYFVYMEKDGNEWKSYKADETTCDKGEVENMVWKNGNQVTVSAFYNRCYGFCSKDEYRNTNSYAMIWTDQSKESLFKQCDNLYMEPTSVIPSFDAISVNLKHLMSKLIITIVSESEVADVKVGGTFHCRKFYPTATDESSRWGEITSLKILDVTACKDSYDEENGISKYEVILTPQTTEEPLSVSFTMGGKNYKWTSDASVTLQSGKVYTLELLADLAGKAVAVSVNVDEWPDETITITGGSADEVTTE